MIVSVFAGIVTYNPDCDKLLKNVESIISQVQEVVIFDNGSSNFSHIEALANSFESVSIINSLTNKGIAYALNRIFEFCQSKECEWLLTLDQDSICPRTIISVLSSIISENTAIACPLIYDINQKNTYEESNDITDINRCITSGALTSVRAWRDVNGFDEKMFIDGVDFDFCDRVRKKGYHILQSSKVVLYHEIGHITMHKVLWFTVAVKNHSAFRKYYIAKNIVYLDRKNNEKYYPIKTVMRICKQLLLVIVFESDKIIKIQSIIRGAKDGFKEYI